MLTTFHIVKAMVFPVVMYGCESWTIKKVEWWRIDAFKLWCWIRLLRVPWTVRRSNESILKEINPEYSLEGLMLKLQYFGHLMWKTDSLEKTLMLGKTVGRRRRGQQRMRWLDTCHRLSVEKKMATHSSVVARRIPGTAEPGGLPSMGSHRVGHDWNDLAAAAAAAADSVDMSKLWETVKHRRAWHAAVHGVAMNRTQISNWTTITLLLIHLLETILVISVFLENCSAQWKISNLYSAFGQRQRRGNF